MRHLITTVLMLFSTGFLAQQPTAETAGTVDVVGHAEVSLKADYIVLRVAVEHEDADPAAAQEALMAQSRRILEYLKSQEAVEDVKTEAVQLQPRVRDYQKNEKSYYARQSLSFKIMEVERYESIIPELMKRGINGIDHIQFKSTEEEEYQKMLLQRALLDAREKAVLLAGELGQEIGKAVFISDRISTGGPVEKAALAADSRSSSRSVEAGMIELTATVNVHFELK